jgi:hypothetical protein
MTHRILLHSFLSHKIEGWKSSKAGKQLNEGSKQCLLHVVFLLYLGLTSEDGNLYIPPKHRLLFTVVHSVMLQKTKLI